MSENNVGKEYVMIGGRMQGKTRDLIHQLIYENKQLKEQLQQRDSVIEEAREFINKIQYDPELKNKVYGINYGGTIKLLDILNKCKKEESE